MEKTGQGKPQSLSETSRYHASCAMTSAVRERHEPGDDVEESLSSESASARSQQQQKEASRRAALDARERIPSGAGGAARSQPAKITCFKKRRAHCGLGSSYAHEPVKRIAPGRPNLTIFRAAACAKKKTPVRLTSICIRQSAAEIYSTLEPR